MELLQLEKGGTGHELADGQGQDRITYWLPPVHLNPALHNFQKNWEMILLDEASTKFCLTPAIIGAACCLVTLIWWGPNLFRISTFFNQPKLLVGFSLKMLTNIITI